MDAAVFYEAMSNTNFVIYTGHAHSEVALHTLSWYKKKGIK